MKPVKFDYARPSTFEAALELLSDEARNAKVLAGGQSLGPLLNMRLVRPGLLVDITGIPELCRFEDRGAEIAIGACVSHSDIEDLRVPDFTRGALPFVASGIAYRAVRTRGTLGGSLAHADPASDWVAILAALGATVELRGATGLRAVALEAFVLGALESDIRHDEILVSARAPKLGPKARWGYYKVCRKPGELAQAIGAVLIDAERDRFRAVIAATEAKPIVIADAKPLLSGDGSFDRSTVEALMVRAGLGDPIDRRVHFVALARAHERALTQ
ncbi:MAG TPA: FAD binding domain-containing protein [Roseiarcus sp.]|nr:FAD binding domain-containing protein [Roseiarcus sp.]